MLLNNKNIFVILGLLVLTYGCGNSGPHEGAIVFGEASGQCGPGSFMRAAIPDEVVSVAVRVTGQSGNPVNLSIQKQALNENGLLIPNLKPGNYEIDIAACDQKGNALYGTVKKGIAVKENEKVGVKLYLPRLDALNCVGGTNTSPLVPDFQGDDFNKNGASAFACMLNRGDTTWIIGGFNQLNNTGSDPMATMQAGKAIWQYNRDLGLFLRPQTSDGKPMELPKAWAAGHCIDMDAGILLVGGTDFAKLGPRDYPGTAPPVLFKSSDALAKQAYLVTNSQASAVTLPYAVYPYSTITRLSSRKFMACGGMKPDGTAVSECRVFTWKDDRFVISPKILLHTPRYGHAAIALTDGKVLLLGGYSKDATTMPLELINPDNPDKDEVGPDMDKLAFQGAWMISSNSKNARILVVGGNDIRTGTKNKVLIVSIVKTDKGFTLTNASINELKIAKTWPQTSFPTQYQIDGQPILAYGFRFFTQAKDEDCHGPVCLPDRINLLQVDQNKISVSQSFPDTSSRLGATIVSTGGNILIFGGIQVDNGFHLARTELLLTRPNKLFKEMCSVH